MLLTQVELQSLIEVKQRTPHQLLGMHPLPDGTGVVVRALVPDAAKIEVQPAREKDKPAFELTRLHKAGLFEGVTTEATRVYAYDLVITDAAGPRPPHARSLFLSADAGGVRICSSSARATSAGFMISWARNCARLTAWPAPASPFGRPMPSGSAWWAISTTGTGAVTRCGRWGCQGCGRSSFPA